MNCERCWFYNMTCESCYYPDSIDYCESPKSVYTLKECPRYGTKNIPSESSVGVRWYEKGKMS